MSATLTTNCLESQLCENKKGAFTGAEKDQKGLLAEAEKGTFLLDEVTEIPMALQAKLLRVLQEREYSPIGETKVIPFDVKIMSASSLSLEQAVADGKFREDLRYRLEVMPIHLPPLRERHADKGILFEYFLQNQLARHGYGTLDIDEAVYTCIDSYHWPGNVRELVNVCTYIAALTAGDDTLVTLDKLPPTLRAPVKKATSLTNDAASTPSTQALEKPILSKDALEQAIVDFQGHRETIARYFGVSRMTLWRRMKEFDLT